MKIIFSLLGLICVALVSGDTAEGETEDLDTNWVEKAKKFLQEDEITLKIVEEFEKLRFNPELKALMHLLLNQLLVSRQLFGHGRENLQKMPQFPQLEYERNLETLSSPEKQEAFKLEPEMINTEIASSINVAFETTYTGGDKVIKGEVESLDSILPTEEVISPLRVGTINTLVSQLLGTLMMADTDAFAIFSEDKISFSKDHWMQILIEPILEFQMHCSLS